jgi:hypothetical protein
MYESSSTGYVYLDLVDSSLYDIYHVEEAGNGWHQLSRRDSSANMECLDKGSDVFLRHKTSETGAPVSPFPEAIKP